MLLEQIRAVAVAWRKSKISQPDWPSHARVFLEGARAAAKACDRLALASNLDDLIEDFDTNSKDAVSRLIDIAQTPSPTLKSLRANRASYDLKDLKDEALPLIASLCAAKMLSCPAEAIDKGDRVNLYIPRPATKVWVIIEKAAFKHSGLQFEWNWGHDCIAGAATLEAAEEALAAWLDGQ